jgi:hypothetical protein
MSARSPEMLKFFYIGIVLVVLGVLSITFGMIVFDVDDMIFFLIVGIILLAGGGFLIALYITPDKVTKLIDSLSRK